MFSRSHRIEFQQHCCKSCTDEQFSGTVVRPSENSQDTQVRMKIHPGRANSLSHSGRVKFHGRVLEPCTHRVCFGTLHVNVPNCCRRVALRVVTQEPRLAFTAMTLTTSVSLLPSNKAIYSPRCLAICNDVCWFVRLRSWQGPPPSARQCDNSNIFVRRFQPLGNSWVFKWCPER